MSTTFPLSYPSVHTPHVEVSKGNENFLINGFRSFCNIPRKFLYWNSSLESGNVSDQTIKRVTDYLEENALYDVHVSVNKYAPFTQVGRIFSNPKTSILTKLVMGPLAAIGEFLPLKLCGFSYYNSLANTVHLFSNDEDIALSVAGTAREVNKFALPGIQCIIEGIPFFGSWFRLSQSAGAIESTTNYVKRTESLDAYKRSYRVIASKLRLDSFISSFALDVAFRALASLPVFAALSIGRNPRMMTNIIKDLSDNEGLDQSEAFYLMETGLLSVALTAAIGVLGIHASSMKS